MATTHSLLHSYGSSFLAQFRTFPPQMSSSVLHHGNRHGNAVVFVKATAAGAVLVEKSEVEKVPKIEKIVVNCGIGDAAQNAKDLEAAISDLALITGQRPVKTRVRASVATFKIREGQPLWIAVTLRGSMMYSFLDRVVKLELPRTRDFQGVNSNNFDGNGIFNIGIKEQGVFPEIRADVIGKPRGMDICITTTTKTDQEA
ncbi:Ribosomal protein L5 [Sesbania bispinosa]|nr:Ribosomal protein L5 [Sesbania bispinosa]